jgi:hypothetical protein
MKASGAAVFTGTALVVLGCVGMWAVANDQAIAPDAPTVAPSPGSVASIHVPADVIARIYPDMTIPPCPTEDSDDCYWDATQHGNGKGRSFVYIGGHTYFAEGK